MKTESRKALIHYSSCLLTVFRLYPFINLLMHVTLHLYVETFSFTHIISRFD